MSPQERKELQRSETDERNIAIREKAAQSSWYWTLYLLWVPFVISLVREETLWIRRNGPPLRLLYGQYGPLGQKAVRRKNHAHKNDRTGP